MKKHKYPDHICEMFNIPKSASKSQAQGYISKYRFRNKEIALKLLREASGTFPKEKKKDSIPSAESCIKFVESYSAQVQASLPPVTTVTPPRMATVKVRGGQAAFRLRVLDNFNNRCAVTGHVIGECLQAAHITPYCDSNDNSVTNGIALDATLHLLFDAGLMAINPDTLTVHFKCEHPYRIHEGRKLATPKVAINASALSHSWAKFQLRG